ncbi:MAG: hypothetical protein QG597_3251 [Actinomycetota bacterium]|nr:hypothetical protein [Actinomycetota bacterium]
MSWTPATGVHLSGEDIRGALTWDALVTSQREVFKAHARGEAELAPRALLPYGDNTAFSYLARASRDGWPVVKIGSVNPGNPARGLPSVHAFVLVMDRTTGDLAATMDGETITTMRTPAASVAAIEALASWRADGLAPQQVVVVGAGRQGMAHVDVMLERYPEAQVTTVVRRGVPLVPAGPSEGSASHRLRVTDDIRRAVESADTVILCTSSFDPVVSAGWFAEGATLVSVGSFAPNRHEFGPDVIERAGQVFVDDVSTSCQQCGPVAAAVSSGLLERGDVHAIGDVMLGRTRAPDVARELTVYASVGLGIQDASVVDLLMANHHGG